MGLIEPRHSFELQRPVVLVIDDSPSHRLLMTSLLEQEGYRAVAAQDGEAGVLYVAAEGEDGFDALSRSFGYVFQRAFPYAGLWALAWALALVLARPAR